MQSRMTMTTPVAVPATADELVISLNYDPTGLEWVDLFDNSILAWIVDAADLAASSEPRIIGTFPPAPPDTSPVVSPVWATIARNGMVYVPDIFRGRLLDFFTWLATNGDAQRRVGGKGLSSQYVRQPYDVWASSNPTLVFDHDNPADAAAVEAAAQHSEEQGHRRRRHR